MFVKEGDKVIFLGLYGDVVKVDGSKAMLRLYDGAKVLVWKYLLVRI